MAFEEKAALVAAETEVLAAVTATANDLMSCLDEKKKAGATER